MLGSPRLSAVNEDKECLTKTIDRCKNNSSYYQIQAGIDLMAKAKFLLQQKDYQFRTDGRRILAYHSYLIKEKDDESIQLLKNKKRWQPERKEIHIPTTKFGNVETDDDASNDGSNH
ncbi:hypothetical protein Gotur_034382 [Gossypium turneri]